MEMVFKTKTVSDELGVNPTTIQRWVKHFNLPCQKNDHGHYLFSEEDIESLREIKQQLDSGLLMNDIAIVEGKKEKQKEQPRTPSIAALEDRFALLIQQIERLEKKVEEKADDVLSYQVLQHSTEMDEMMNKLTVMEERMQEMEGHVTRTLELATVEPMLKKPRKNWLVSLFSL
ncbi:polar chromosome segregation protein [Fictibacillus macauensis ZFHKF-1]|uniref:Chromosome-anchoring protein RacA n=1 Tax=Fictibacillus macauensis ZFHKF-1 TaxID=1196324 RepID=I8AL79_9BACL|nr:MerR family transcriptional regulator [Fictibacillus macauensis]EIT86632.1 polar chromosome segregation protein [Fictibacillus macauensis ZFHKF-1]